MRINATIKLNPSRIDDTGVVYHKWLLTNVGLQTISWEWVYIGGELYVAFYHEKDATAFKLRFEL